MKIFWKRLRDRYSGRDPWIAVPMTALIPAAYVASFFFLTHLAIQAGWPKPVAVLLPLVLDCLATVAWRFYWLTRDRFALSTALGATAATVAGNTAAHLYADTPGGPAWWVVSLVAAVPPVAIGLAVILDARCRPPVTPVPVAVPRVVRVQFPRTVRVEPAVPVAPPAAVASVPTPRAAPRPVPAASRAEELAAVIRARGIADLSGDKLAKELKTSKSVALAAKRLAVSA